MFDPSVLSTAIFLPLTEDQTLRNSNEKCQSSVTFIDYLTIVNPQTLLPEESLTTENSSLALVVVNYFGVRLLDNIYI